MVKKLLILTTLVYISAYAAQASLEQASIENMLAVLEATRAQIPPQYVGTTYGSGSAGFKKLVEKLETAITEERTEHESTLKSTASEPALKEEDVSAATKRAEDAETAHQQTQAELATIKENTEKLAQEKQVIAEELNTAKKAQQTCEKELDAAKAQLATETLRQLTEQVKAKKIEPESFTQRAREFIEAMRNTVEADFAKE